MPDSTWKADPSADGAARDVLAAYDAAVKRGNPPVDCYRAGIAVWRQAHPDHVRAYAARQALDIILAARARLTV